MIICNKCGSTDLIVTKESMECKKCSNKYIVKNNILYFDQSIESISEGFDSKRLEAAVEKSHHKKHFWFSQRIQFIENIFNKYVPKSFSILDIGSGTASLAEHLSEKEFRFNISDIHDAGIKAMMAKQTKIEKAFQFDIYHPPFKEEFDVVSMFDVLEHLSDDNIVVSNCKKILKPEGLFIITVPAHQWLWNRNDRVQYHKRRYNKHQLEKLLTENGFELVYSKYFFIAITPLLYLRKVLSPDDGSQPNEQELNQEFKINKNINYILELLTKIEFKLLDFLPNLFGGSLCIVAKKVKES